MKTVSAGITGGIGSGKSEVCRIFAKAGARVLHSDAMATEIINNDPAVRRRLIQRFGKDCYLPDGTLDRKRMGKLVFHDPEAQAGVNSIVHPVVIDAIEKEIEAEKKHAKFHVVAVESALIVEAGIRNTFDYLVVVDAPEEIRITRLMERDSITRQEAAGRIGSQMSSKKKTEDADFIIGNSGDRIALQDRTLIVYRMLAALAGDC